MSDPERVELGCVVGAHALRGEVRVRFFGDGPQNLLRLDAVWLGEHRGDRDASRYEIRHSGTGRRGEVRLALAGVEDRSAAEALRGFLVLGGEASLEPLGEDEFYWHQLVGCWVETQQGESVGQVREIWQTGGHDVLRIDTQDGRQVLVPTAREIMTRVDLDDRRIVINAIPGLLE